MLSLSLLLTLLLILGASPSALGDCCGGCGGSLPFRGKGCVDSRGRPGHMIADPLPYSGEGVVLAMGVLPRCRASNQPPTLGEDGAWRCPSEHYTLDGLKTTWPGGRTPHFEPAACAPVN